MSVSSAYKRTCLNCRMNRGTVYQIDVVYEQGCDVRYERASCGACGYNWVDRHVLNQGIGPGAIIPQPPSPTFITTNDASQQRDPLTRMLDDTKEAWDKLPKSTRLAYLILARGEFGQLTDVSYHITKSWKEEHPK